LLSGWSLRGDTSEAGSNNPVVDPVRNKLFCHTTEVADYLEEALPKYCKKAPRLEHGTFNLKGMPAGWYTLPENNKRISIIMYFIRKDVKDAGDTKFNDFQGIKVIYDTLNTIRRLQKNYDLTAYI